MNRIIGDKTLVFYQIDLLEFYEEIVTLALYRIGDDATVFDYQAMFSYMQEAFKVSEEVHNKALSNVKLRKPPKVALKVSVFEANDLPPRDSKGSLNPFVSLFLKSDPCHHLTTEIRMKTMNPQFDEHFSL